MFKQAIDRLIKFFTSKEESVGDTVQKLEKKNSEKTST